MSPDLTCDPDSAVDLLATARVALANWRQGKDGSAAERKAARMLAWSFGRLDSLGVIKPQ